MVLVFYNKLLLRAIVFLIGALSAVCAWHYIALSAQKLGSGGVRDALAIVSFLIAAWLVMLIAEVADNHYVRVLGGLCYCLGAFITFKWIFVVDGPKLLELPGGAQRLQFANLAYWLAVGLAILMLAILITRLILDRLSYGRAPEQVVAPQYTATLGEKPPGMGEPAKPEALAPIPVDVSPITGATPLTPAPMRIPAPVRRLVGVGGAYAGSSFELGAGVLKVGREAADILLASDNQVSRSHASFETGPEGLVTLRDPGSTNGTYVNGARVTEIVLAPGDTVQFGTSQFKAEA